MTADERREREIAAVCDGALRLVQEIRRRQLAGTPADPLEPARVNVPTANGDTAWS